MKLANQAVTGGAAVVSENVAGTGMWTGCEGAAWISMKRCRMSS